MIVYVHYLKIGQLAVVICSRILCVGTLSLVYKTRILPWMTWKEILQLIADNQWQSIAVMYFINIDIFLDLIGQIVHFYSYFLFYNAHGLFFEINQSHLFSWKRSQTWRIHRRSTTNFYCHFLKNTVTNVIGVFFSWILLAVGTKDRYLLQDKVSKP